MNTNEREQTNTVKARDSKREQQQNQIQFFLSVE